jgi:hypothetical protein
LGARWEEQRKQAALGTRKHGKVLNFLYSEVEGLSGAITGKRAKIWWVPIVSSDAFHWSAREGFMCAAPWGLYTRKHDLECFFCDCSNASGT